MTQPGERPMDYATLAGDALLAGATVGASITARHAHRNRKTLEHNSTLLRALADPELDRRIHEAVIDVLQTQEGQRLREQIRGILTPGD